MRRPSPADVALLARPTLADAVRGALYAWGIFTVAVAVLAASASALEGGGPGLGVVPSIVILTAVVTALASGVIIGVWGIPTGLLLGRLLSRTRLWGLHAAAHFAWGAATALLVLAIFQLVTSGRTDLLAPPIWTTSAALTAAAGLSTLAGWALAWRAAIRRSGQVALPLITD